MDTEGADLFGSDGEQIPFIFVPHGAPEPLAWMARHPDWVKIPATMVPRGQTREGAGRGDGVSVPSGLVVWGDSPSTVMAPSSVPMSGGDIGAFMEARPEDRSSTAVAAFLDVNRALERVLTGQTIARPSACRWSTIWGGRSLAQMVSPRCGPLVSIRICSSPTDCATGPSCKAFSPAGA